MTQCVPKRDARVKPAHDGAEKQTAGKARRCNSQGGGEDQAARTVLRKRATWVFRRWPSADSDWAEDRTWDEAEPVSLAPLLTSEMLATTCAVPAEACCTLRVISWVAAPCSSTAAAIV